MIRAWHTFVRICDNQKTCFTSLIACLLFICRSNMQNYFIMRGLRLKRQKIVFYLLGGRKIRPFSAPTSSFLSHGKTESPIQKFTSFSVRKVTDFLAYYRQLLSTKCIEIVYSFLEKRKSIVVSFDFAGKKKNYGKVISSFPFF